MEKVDVLPCEGCEASSSSTTAGYSVCKGVAEVKRAVGTMALIRELDERRHA